MARHFNGTSDFINMGTGVRGADLIGVLAMCWVNLDDLASEHTPMSRWNNTSSEQWILTIPNTGLVNWVCLDSTFAGRGVAAVTPLTTGVWTHIAGMFTGSNLYVFINGNVDNHIASSFTLNHNTSVAVNIGRQSNGTAWFKGSIAEANLILVNTAVNSDAQMQALVKAAASGASISDAEGMFDTDHIGYWPLLGDSPERCYTANTGNSGTVTGTTVVNHPGVRTLTSFRAV